MTILLPQKIILPGVFMRIFGVGTLITGDSCSGKSELALDLIQRGHALIADDAPEFHKNMKQQVIGTCPALLQNYLAVRGLGILDIKQMFGKQAVKYQHALQLIIALGSNIVLNEKTLLHGTQSKQKVFNISIPKIQLTQSSAHLCTLVETAAKQFLLAQQGHNATIDFINRQQVSL